MRRYFITGTDTDAGKTLVTAAMLAKARRKGLTTLGLKPVAAGCERHIEGLRNTDACLLQALSFPEVDYHRVNPIALEPPIAPHLAASQAGLTLRLSAVEEVLQPALSSPVRDLLLIEGAGGWRVPLNDEEDLSGLAVRLDLPVILVVGTRLGCISHARLTLEAIRSDGLQVAGWIATQTDHTMREYEANLKTLYSRLDAPCLGVIPWLGEPAPQSGLEAHLAMAEAAASHLEGLDDSN